MRVSGRKTQSLHRAVLRAPTILRITLLMAGLSAAAVAHSAGYVSGKVDIMQQAFGGWIVKLEGNQNPDGCSKDHIILSSSVSQYDEIYSMFLTAYVAEKSLTVHVNGCDAAGYKQYSFIYANW